MSEVTRCWDSNERPLAVPGVDQALFDGEAVLFRAESKTVHRLGAVVGAVWLLCDGETPVAQIVDDLGAVFSLQRSEIDPHVREALSSLESEGLLVGSERGRPASVQPDPTRALDGSTVVTALGEGEGIAAAGTNAVAVRVGVDRGHVVIVGADDPDLARRLRVLLAAHVDDEFDLSGRSVALMLHSDEQRSQRGLGSRAVPHLGFGRLPMFRDRQIDSVIRSLAAILGGIHFQQVRSDDTWLGLRPYVRGQQMVLCEAPRPLLLNDPVLCEQGILELPAWAVMFEADGSIVVPPAIGGLDWAGVGIEPAPDTWRRFHLAGLAVRSAGSIPDAVAALATLSVTESWFQVVAGFAERGALVMAEEAADLRGRLRTLFDGPHLS